MNRERRIERAIIEKPGRIGFAGAQIIRNVRVAPNSGLVDVMLLPKTGSVKLALVEVKHSGAGDASSKVIGQLLMYYSGALSLGSNGLSMLRAYTRIHKLRARSAHRISPKQLTGGVSPPTKAWEVLQSGRRLRPNELELYIGLDAPPRESLMETLSVLKRHHRLNIGVIVVSGKTAEIFRIGRFR